MKFYYFYPLRKSNGSLRYDLPIHILRNEETNYLCSAPQIKGPAFKNEWLKPGLKLCDICKRERDRLRAGDPTKKQVANWWIGGLDDYRSEKTTK